MSEIVEITLEVPKKYLHSLTHFCRNNHYKFRFENMHSIAQEKMAKFTFRDSKIYAEANSFLCRLIDLDRVQPEEAEKVDKRKEKNLKDKRH